MSMWLIIPLCLVGFLLLDALLRVLMLPPRVHQETVLGSGHLGHLLVYLPGILADGTTSANEVKDSWMAHAGAVMLVDYGHQRFNSNFTNMIVAKKIGQPVAIPGGGKYNRITIIGGSMGGKLAADLIGLLHDEYNWPVEALELIMVDVPPSPEYFAGPGRVLNRVLSLVYAGPLLSLLLMLPLRASLVLPKDENIEEVPGEDITITRQRVKTTAKARMSVFWFSATCDQQRYLARPFDWDALHGVMVIYMVCLRDNETVIQPDAVLDCQENLPSLTEVVEVDSTHVGHLERPGIWRRAYKRAFLYLG